MAGIDKDVVKKVAKIARLHLTEKEAEKISKDLESILEAFRDMDTVNTKNVRPSFHPVETVNILRKDMPAEGLTQEEALSNAKHRENGYFIGPKAV